MTIYTRYEPPRLIPEKVWPYLRILALCCFVAFMFFCIGQDHPKPGTTIGAKESSLLVQAASNAGQVRQLEHENQILQNQATILQNEVDNMQAANQSEVDAYYAAAQNITAEEDHPTKTEVEPFSLPITVEAQVDSSLVALSDLWIKVSDGRHGVIVPLDGSWVRLNSLIEVCYNTDPNTMYSGGDEAYRMLIFRFRPYFSPV